MTDNEFQTLLLRMDDGFGNVYEKIDNLNKEFVSHKEVCINRFVEIEQKQSIGNALGKQRNCFEKEKRDYWKYFIRTAIVVMTAGMAGIIWKLFIANISLLG